MANSKIVTAINAEKIDNCILELTNYIEKLKMVFLRLDDAINSTNNFYRTEAGTAMRNKYSIFRDNYNVIVANMSSYIDELKTLKANYGVLNDRLSLEISKSTQILEESYERYQG